MATKKSPEVKKTDVKKLRDDITLLGKGQTQLRKGFAEVLGTVSKVEDQMGPAIELVNKTRAELTKLRRDPNITVPGHLDKKMVALEAELKRTKEKLAELRREVSESGVMRRQTTSLLADRLTVVEAGLKQMDALGTRLDELESIVQTQQEAIDELTEPDDEPKPDESKQVTLDEAIQRAEYHGPEVIKATDLGTVPAPDEVVR